MATKFRTWDDYFIPGTSVLRNKVGATTEPDLKAKEEARSFLRITQLAAEPITGSYDYAHMKAIHRHIFQDVYEWAGEQRVGPSEPDVMNKGDFQFAPLSFITPHLTRQYERLSEHDRFRDVRETEFTDKLADVWGEINFAHAFREGNTRAQIVFFDQFCEQAGYELDRGAFLPGTATRDEFVEARFHAVDTGNHDKMREFLDKVVTPPSSSPTASLDAELKTRRQRYPELFRSDEADGEGRDLEM